jgi:glycerophosphoryl diester phosphodiesterase
MIRSAFGLLLSVLIASVPTSAQPSPFIIAHRGASGYLPEHTLAAASYAHAQRADYIEQDVVLTRDDVLIVLHDIHLDTTTDVATKFPTRHRDDGRFYTIDFDWAEIRGLRVRERFNPHTGDPVFPDRFSRPDASFRVCTMEEQLRLILGLNQSTGRTVGVCPEIKQPAWHRQQGKDIGTALIALLNQYGLQTGSVPVIVQCFEAAELQRLREVTDTAFPFLQLTGASFESTLPALQEIATYAQAIGPHLSQVMTVSAATRLPHFSTLVTQAHALGLQVIPYTLRGDTLPEGIPSAAKLHEAFLSRAQIDGIFTDFPDTAVAWRDQHSPERN